MFVITDSEFLIVSTINAIAGCCSIKQLNTMVWPEADQWGHFKSQTLKSKRLLKQSVKHRAAIMWLPGTPRQKLNEKREDSEQKNMDQYSITETDYCYITSVRVSS